MDGKHERHGEDVGEAAGVYILNILHQKTMSDGCSTMVGGLDGITRTNKLLASIFSCHLTAQ